MLYNVGMILCLNHTEVKDATGKKKAIKVDLSWTGREFGVLNNPYHHFIKFKKVFVSENRREKKKKKKHQEDTFAFARTW